MFRDFIALLFPSTCALCHEGLTSGENLICLKCLYQLPRYFQDLNQDEIYLHFIQSYNYEAFYAYLKYYKKGITQKLLYQIKYNRMPDLGDKIGFMMGYAMKTKNRDLRIDLILPVPLHPKKKKKRGYNQSDYFARGIARALSTEWSDSEIKRIRNNDTQTNKSRQERIENVSRIFKVIHPQHLQNKHILLVDDVITTGATLESCADAIRQDADCKLSLAAMAIAK